MIKDNKITKYLLLFFTIFFINTMSVFAQEIDVEEFKVLDKSTTTEVDNISFDSNTVTSNIKFNNVNDYVDFGLNLKNKSNNKYKIVSITDNNKNKNLDITYEYEDEEFSNNDITNVKIKMLYKKKLINEDKKLIDDLKVTIVLEDNNGNQEQIIINPNTRDNIIFYVVIFIIAAIALILLKHNYKKTSILIILLTIASIPVFIFAKEEYKVNIYFDSIEVKGFYEDYTITVDEDNDNTYSFEIKAGQPIGDLPSPTKRGYTFKEWQDGNGNVITDETIAKKNMTIKAIYNINTYNITYNLNEGSATNVTSYTVEDEVVLNNPTKLGYIFVGWTGSNGDNPEVDLVINRGTIGNKEYTANFIIDNNVPYTVIHKKQNVTGSGYTTADTEHKTGTASQEITPEVKDYYGFTAPSTQTTTIEPDGSTVVTYEYTRNRFTLTLQDTEMIDTEFTSGDYYYETSITVKAKAKQGYNFVRWSTGSTENNYTFNLNENTTLKPIYEARTDTPYTVIHKKQNVTGSGYTVAETENLQGKTDSPITPGVKEYTGFNSPSTQTTTIKPDGSTVVTYEYTRIEYTLTINNSEYVETETPSGTYRYEQSITLTAKPKTGYRFIKWSNDETTQSIAFSMESNVTIEPIYEVNSYIIRFDKNDDDATGSMDEIELDYGESVTLPANGFTKQNYIIDKWNTKRDGTGTSYDDLAEVSNLTTGHNVTITLYVIWKENLPSYSHPDPITFDGQTMIDTGIQLFTEDLYQKNFEISLDIDNIDQSRFEQTANKDTIVGSINESGSPWPGTAFRISNKKFEFVGTSGIGTSSKPQIANTAIEKNVKIIRIDEKLYYKVDNTDPVLIKDFEGFNLFFDDTVTLGGALENGVPKPDRYFYGTISNVSIKFISDDAEISDYNRVSNLQTVYELAGPYEFDGTTDKVLIPTYTVDNEETPIRLFTSDNYKKDFEISFNIDSYNREGQVFQATLISTKYENESAGYPGVAVRIVNNDTKFSATSTKNGTRKQQNFPDNVTSVKLIRESGIIKYSYNNNIPITLENYNDFTEFFNTPVSIGGIIDSNNQIDRCIVMTISDLVIKMDP